MALHVNSQTGLVPATPPKVAEEGLPVFAVDVPMAVIIRLERSVEEDPRGRWLLETRDGPRAVAGGSEPPFSSPDEAQQWVLERIARAHTN